MTDNKGIAFMEKIIEQYNTKGNTSKMKEINQICMFASDFKNDVMIHFSDFQSWSYQTLSSLLMEHPCELKNKRIGRHVIAIVSFDNQ